MYKRTAVKVAFLLAQLGFASSFASSELECKYIGGTVKLIPDPSCNINGQYSGPSYLMAPGTCFTVTVKGTLSGTGYAGLTTEQVISPLTSSYGVTPEFMNEPGIAATSNEFGMMETRRFFTGRSTVSLPDGRIFTADAGVLGKTGSTEQLVITRGEGKYLGAQGTLYASGNIFAGAWIAGQICTTED